MSGRLWLRWLRTWGLVLVAALGLIWYAYGWRVAGSTLGLGLLVLALVQASEVWYEQRKRRRP